MGCGGSKLQSDELQLPEYSHNHEAVASEECVSECVSERVVVIEEGARQLVGEQRKEEKEENEENEEKEKKEEPAKKEEEAAEREEAEREEVARLLAEKEAAEREEAARLLAEKEEAEKEEAARLLAEKEEAEREEAARLLAEQEAAEKEEAARLLAEKEAAEKEEAARLLAEKEEAEREEAARLLAEKEAAEKEQAAKLLAEKEEAEREEAARLLAEKEEAEREEAARLLVEKEEAEREEVARLLVEKEAAEKEEAARLLAEQEAAEKEEAARLLAEKEEAEREEAARLLAEKEAAEREEAARLLAEKEAAEREEAARLLAEQEAAEKEEAARLLAEKEAAEREKEAARLLAEKEAAGREKEAARLLAEKEAAEREEAARLLAEKEAAEREEAARLLAEKEAAEKEAARLLAEKEAAEREEAARLLAEKEAVEREEAARLLAEKEEAERSLLLAEEASTIMYNAMESLVTQTELRIHEEEVAAAESKRIRDAMYILAMVTAVKQGWLVHQGHILKARRYCVLAKGVLRLYTKPLEVFPFGQDLKLELTLNDHVLKELSDTMFEIQTIAVSVETAPQVGLLRRLSSRRRSSAALLAAESVVLEASSVKEADDWLSVMSIHMNHFHSTTLDEKKDLVQNVYFKGHLQMKVFFWSPIYAVLMWNKIDYYKDKTLREKLGAFRIIPGSTKLLPKPSKSDGARSQFRLTNGETTIDLAASTDEERCDWELMITRVVFREFGRQYEDKEVIARDSVDGAISDARSEERRSGAGDSDSNIELRDEEILLLLESSIDGIISDLKFVPEVNFQNFESDIGEQRSGTENTVDVQETGVHSLSLLFPGVNSSSVTMTPSGPALPQSSISGPEECTSDLQDIDNEDISMSYLDIRGELKGLFFKLNQGHEYDHDRLLSLLGVLDSNTAFKQKEGEARDKWVAEVSTYAEECFVTQRSFFPSTIFSSCYTPLNKEQGFSFSLAKRLFLNQSLGLVRLPKTDISCLKIEELSGRFMTTNRGLDIVELFAIYHALPATFAHDNDGQKRFWKQCLEENLKHLYTKKLHNSLRPNEKRSSTYMSEKPNFESDTSYFTRIL